MRFYADPSPRRSLQLVGDLIAALCIAACLAIARQVHDKALELAAPGRQVEASATDLEGRLHDAGQALSGVPIVGGAASQPLDGASAAASGLASAGQEQVHAATTFATWLGVAVAVVPVLLILAIYLPPRIRFIRRASAAQRILDGGADLDLFALRALAHQPLSALARVDVDPAGAWRRRDAEVMDRLARLELRAVGVSPPGR